MILTLRSPRTSSTIPSTSHFSRLVRCRRRFPRQRSADLRGVEAICWNMTVVLHVRQLLLALRLSPVTSACTAIALLLLLLLSPSILSRRLSRLVLRARRSRAGTVLGRARGGVGGARAFG